MLATSGFKRYDSIVVCRTSQPRRVRPRVLPLPLHTEGLRPPSSTARIEGPPFHRGASASKEEGGLGSQSAIWPS